MSNSLDSLRPNHEGEEEMKSSLILSTAPLFFAGFLATTFLFGGLAAGGSWIGISAARFLVEPIVELFAGVVGGIATTFALSPSKPK